MWYISLKLSTALKQQLSGICFYVRWKSLSDFAQQVILEDFFVDTQFFVRKKLGGSTKKSFKIAQRYLQGKDGLLTLHGKTKPEVAALVVDNCQLQ